MKKRFLKLIIISILIILYLLNCSVTLAVDVQELTNGRIAKNVDTKLVVAQDIVAESDVLDSSIQAKSARQQCVEFMKTSFRIYWR
mgnify:FL=1